MYFIVLQLRVDNSTYESVNPSAAKSNELLLCLETLFVYHTEILQFTRRKMYFFVVKVVWYEKPVLSLGVLDKKCKVVTTHNLAIYAVQL